MSLQKQISSDMVAAMKSKDVLRTNTLRLVIGEMGRYKEGKKTFKILSDVQVIKVLKFCLEGAKISNNQFEIDLINEYLPKMLDEDGIRLIVTNIFNSGDYNGMKDMGKIMGLIKNMPESAQIDGTISSKIVKELLSK